jgi:hypothetical protein
VHAETLAILGTVAADVFFNRWNLEVLSNSLVPYIPSRVNYYSQSL